MFESLYKHTLVGVLPILQYHIYNTYYELRLTYTRLIILILVYSIIQLSLLLRSISLSDPISSFWHGIPSGNLLHQRKWCNYMENKNIRSSSIYFRSLRKFLSNTAPFPACDDGWSRNKYGPFSLIVLLDPINLLNIRRNILSTTAPFPACIDGLATTQV